MSSSYSQKYDSNYGGPAYSVKYLGIVDGSMGILSRKMAMQGTVKETLNCKAKLVKQPSKIPGMK